jgi:PAS domain S-box-containing protein
VEEVNAVSDLMRILRGGSDNAGGAGANRATDVAAAPATSAQTETTVNAVPISLPSGRGFFRTLAMPLVAVVVLVAVLNAGWSVYQVLGERQAAVRADVSRTAKLLANSVEPLVSGGELSQLRRLVTETAQTGGYEDISVTLPTGHVLAHSEPARINVTALPEKWAAGTVEAEPDRAVSGVRATETVMLAGRGPVNVRVRATAASGHIAIESILVPAGIALAGLGVLGWSLAKSKRMTRPLSLIAEALEDVPVNRAPDAAALKLDERFGAFAGGFNRLLERAATQVPAESAAVAAPITSDLEQAVNILPTGVLIVERTGVIRHANNMGATLAGGTIESVRGKTITELLVDEELGKLIDELRDGRGERRAIEIRRDSAAGEAILRVQCRPLRKDDVGAALITLENITQQKLADGSRSLFIAQATHELRTPLTNMRLAVETIMEDDKGMPESLAPHMNMLGGEVRRLERLVGDMLAVSEIEAGSIKLTRSEVQLDRLLAEMEADHKPKAAEKNIAFSVVLPPKYPQFFGDREKLTQALHNLVGNAIKYTPEGGTVALEVSATPASVSFAVVDTGFGIPEADQARLFQRFARGSDPRVAQITGTGLGLALSRDIARLHGGDITLLSQLDKGSTFTLTLPVGRAKSAGREAA